MGRLIARFSMKYRWWVFGLTAVITLVMGLMIPRISIDTDPENMLSAEQPDRVEHNRIKDLFDLYDMIVVGIVNTDHPQGIFNPDSLTALHRLSAGIEGIDGVISRDMLSLATVDNVEQVTPGTLSFDWMMDTPPANQAEADAIRKAVERLPMFYGTLVSEDGRAAGVYVPIVDKNESHRIATEIQAIIDTLESGDEFHITGQPVAQDTFGVEMFQQMAISAPLAGILIFLIMLYFFRSVPLVVAPMLLAMATVISTMGLLIGLGYTVHIMSSMIPIFLMPIAVVASIHVLSGFTDRCSAGADTQATMEEVIQSLYKPVIFTALTTTVGFASLMLTPIPPVQVFGAFVAVGVLFAMLLTLTFLPAFIAALPQSTVDRMVARVKKHEREGKGADCKLCEFMSATGRFATRHARPLLVSFAALLAVAVFGITQIQINDNPTRWFKQDHRIRVADAVLNHHFAGTYEAYIVLEQSAAADLEQSLQERAQPLLEDAREAGLSLDDQWQQLLEDAREDDPGATLDNLMFALDDLLFDAPAAELDYWEALLDEAESVRSEALYFQTPDGLHYMAELQAWLEDNGHVGKSNSLADLVRTINRELVSGQDEDYRIPDSPAGVAQAILSFQGSHRPHDLWHFVSQDYRSANIWLQLPSGDNQDMQRVVDAVERYTGKNPLPDGVELSWGGSTYVNLVWQNEMVEGMLLALLSAFAIVLLMMIVLFRSLLFGILAVLPLTLTIALIYGVMGLIGKSYDMPVAVLSSLSLGLSVDFAIHFIQRMRGAFDETGSWQQAMDYVFGEPARAITRNAVVISLGFLPLLAAALVPYITVGIFLASIMALSAIVTLLMLPAILRTAPGLFFGQQARQEVNASEQ
ncbi:efflux RND transporter permease subunit [Natronospira bacteriovora]|uniref:MMPL family transporter n=1 Tax=Natronospira bacteriovora TaxID=3069753 RepID=A0ABU0W594_9GAMM|nr:MMPL family transporter [Natronospira sp. AB-CW4]MDQ2069083.1 MMPL family transporter [Natronospira sp. AB-CW4]